MFVYVIHSFMLILNEHSQKRGLLYEISGVELYLANFKPDERGVRRNIIK